MSKSIYTHYVYRITNILLNKHYYGSRSCKNCNPHDDLGIKYFSSSLDKDFIKNQKEHPEHYRYKIIRICESRKDAIALEILLHERFNVGINESFYNRAKQTSKKFCYDPTGKRLSEEHKMKLSEARKGKYIGENNPNYGKKLSEEHRMKLSEAKKGEKHPNYGKKLSKETKRKIGKANAIANKGRKHSEETRKKMSDAQKGKKYSEESLKKMSEAKKGEKNNLFKGYYVTPFGKFTSSIDQQIKENTIGCKAFRRWCKYNDTIISKESYNQSKYLQENFDESIIGKTYKDIGFGFDPV
jgi:hypothetical protein